MSLPKKETNRDDAASRAFLRIEPVQLSAVALAGAFLFFVLLRGAHLPPIDSDSGTALSIVIAFLNGNPDPLIQTQSPPLQGIIYAVPLLLGLESWVLIIPILFSFFLACFLGYLAYRQTNVLLSAALPPLLLLYSPLFADRTRVLTLYPAFVLFAYLGLYFCAQYLLNPDSRLRNALLGSGLLAAALYTFTSGLLFFAIPALFLIISASRQVVKKLVTFYALLFSLVAPWLAWHFAVGGISHFYYYPLGWITTKYLPMINRDFWGHPHSSFSDYFSTMSEVGFEKLLPPFAWALVPLGALFVWRRYGVRGIAFALAVVATLVVPVFVFRPAPFGRYFYPVLPALILLATGGMALMWSWCSETFKLRPSFGLLIIGAISLALAAGFLLGHGAEYDIERGWQSAKRQEMTQFSRFITDERGIVSRDSQIQALMPDNQLYTYFFIEEDDYVTYLSWPDEDAVLNVLSKYDIGWVLLYKNVRWERDYNNSWLTTVTGELPQHYLRIEEADAFLKVASGKTYVLYKVNQKPAD